MDQIKELTSLMNDFEKRNNVSVYFSLCADGSMSINEFWKEETLFSSTTDFNLIQEFLKHTEYVLDEDGLCNDPVEIKLTSPNVSLHIEQIEKEKLEEGNIVDKIRNLNLEDTDEVMEFLKTKYSDLKI